MIVGQEYPLLSHPKTLQPLLHMSLVEVYLWIFWHLPMMALPLH